MAKAGSFNAQSDVAPWWQLEDICNLSGKTKPFSSRVRSHVENHRYISHGQSLAELNLNPTQLRLRTRGHHLVNPRRPALPFGLIGFLPPTVVSAPVHPFRLWREFIGDARCAAELLPNVLSFEEHPAVTRFVLAVIRELVTMPASENGAAVQDCHTSPASGCGTPEPNPRAAVVAPRPL
jgi:hypothetical protein